MFIFFRLEIVMSIIFELIKNFSTDYANGITAIATVGAVILSGFALFYVRREYFAKYRPYVVPVVNALKKSADSAYVIEIISKNVGMHPCNFKLTDINLKVGDEMHTTPSFSAWMLLGTVGAGIKYPAGYVNQVGVDRIRNNQNRNNRVELSFKLHTTSIQNQFESCQEHIFEINLLTDEPHVFSRPEWVKSIT